MRIRGAKTELEEAGLETEGMVDSTAKLRSEILALSGVDIMENANEFKSTYKIMDELAQKWEDLSDIQQATVTELIAGKRQGNIVSSLMTNFDTAREALETSLNSAGSAMAEHEKWQQSLEAQINSLKASWQGLSQTFLNSDFLKVAFDLIIKLVDGITLFIDKVGVIPTLFAGFSIFKSFSNKGLFKTINSDLDGFINKIGIANKSFADLSNAFNYGKTGKGLKGFISGLSAMKNSLSATLTKTDLSNIQAYNNLLDQGVTAQTAWYRTMQSSSDAAKDLVQSANGSKVALNGMKTASTGVKVGLIGAKVAAIAFNAALTVGISLLINWAVSGIQKIINAKKELAEEVDELTSKFKEQHDELQKLKGDFDTTNDYSMISKYEKLSKGVDNLGRNVSLTADEYSEYQSIVNKIAEQFPELIDGYDSQGQYLLSCKDNVEALTQAYEDMISAQNRAILNNAGKIGEDFANAVKENESTGFWGTNLSESVVEQMERDLNDVLSYGKLEDYYYGTTNGVSDAKAIEKALESAGLAEFDKFSWDYIFNYNETIGKAFEEAAKTNPKRIQEIIDEFRSGLEADVVEMKSIAQATLSDAFDISDSKYYDMSDTMQGVAKNIVNGLDYAFYKQYKDNPLGVQTYVNDMLDQLKSMSDIEGAAIETAFDLKTQFNGGDIPYGEYIQGLESTGKTIDQLISSGKLDKEIGNQIKLSIGLNEDGLVDEYDRLKKRLASEDYFSTMPSETTPFLESLSADELSVIWDVIPKLEKTEYKETIADVKAALEKEMMLQGLTFDLNLEVEEAGIDALNTALSESVSATGLSSESISALKGRYAELESQGYDLSSMFEETSTGIRINRQEFNKLENAYATDRLEEIDGELTDMKSAYDDLGKAIKNTDDPIRKAELYNDRQTLAKRISEAATLAAQYEGLTSAYNDWLKAEEAGQERDMYEKLIEGFENVDDEISRGWVDDGTIEFLELLTGRTDLAGKSGKQLKEVYDGLDKTIGSSGYSIRDFFTVNEDGDSTNTGVYNFLETIESFGGKFKEAIKRNEDGNIIGFNFEVAGGDEAIADALGISEELVQIMVRAADDAGFVISMDGTYKQLADLQNEAKAAADYLRKIGKTDFQFDFNTSSVENLKTQLEEAHKILDDKKFWNKDGTFNFDADGATEAMQVVSTIQAKLDKLTEEQYGIGLTVDDEELEEPLKNLQDYGRTVQTLNQLKLNPEVNADKIEELEGDLKEISEYFANLDDDLKVDLGLDADDNWEDVKKKIESGELKIPTVLDIQANMDKNIETLADLALLNSGLLSEDEEKVIEKKYKIEAKADDIDTSDVDDKVDNAIIDGLGNPILSREANIEIIAETFGIEDIDDLSSKLKGLDDKTIQAIAKAIGEGDVESLNLAITGMDNNTVQAVAEALGYSDVETLKTAIRNMQGNEVDAKVNTDGQIGKVDALQSSIDGLEGKEVSIWLRIKKAASSLWSWVNGNKSSTRNDSNGYNESSVARGGRVNGTANARNAFVNGTSGRAFKQGDWRTKITETALTGELGQELVVTGNRWYTVGDNGAEFATIPKGSIVFNHKQTEELFKNGKVISSGGRGKALVRGTALSSGTGGFGKVSTDNDKVEVDAEIVTINTKDYSTGGSSGSGGGVGKVEGSAVGKNAIKEFEETFDWISIAIDRIEREIDNLDKKVNNTYKSWGDRNAALTDEITKVGEEIKLQSDAAYEYLNKAGEFLNHDSDYAKKIQEGTLDIDTLNQDNSNEELVEKIKEYQKWYELYLKCTDAAEELKQTEAELYAQRFEHIQSQYDGILQGFDHTETMLNEYISQAEAKGHIVSKQYYDALISNEHARISELKGEQKKLIDARDEYFDEQVKRYLDEHKNASKAEAETAIKYSEEWIDMSNDIDSVTQEIEEGTTAIIEYNNAIRDIDWQVFDLIQERISDVTDEANFLIELMSNEKLFDDNGKFTEHGVATVGLHALNYNTAMYQADEYAKEIAELDKQIAEDSYDQELVNRRQELIELQRESILAAEDEKNAIRDLVQDGIDAELDSLSELIDKKNEALESERNLYEYQKKVKEQTSEIANLEKKMAAYSGDDSEEAKQKIQQIKLELETAKEDLQETEYDKFIDDTSALLDSLYTEYELILNQRLDNIDFLLQQVIYGINAAAGVDGTITSALGSEGAIAAALGSNATTIKDTLKSETDKVGTTLSNEMNEIWSTGDGNAKSVIIEYGKGFQSAQTTTNTVLGNIKADITKMVDDVDKDAKENIEQPKTQPSAVANPTGGSSGNSGSGNSGASNGDNKSTGDGKPKIGDKVKFLHGKYYYDSQGVHPAGSQNHGKYVYITNVNNRDWATHPIHISTGKKLGKGDLGWLKREQISEYATGKKNFLNNEIAWTQENGQELIVRPSDGAILTPVAKGDSVLTSAASNNIWDMANNPSEFIKDNLKLGDANIPNNSNVNNSYSQHIDNVVFRMDNVKNYEQLLSEMQKDKNFERLILSMSIDRLAGKSGLAKNKSIR